GHRPRDRPARRRQAVLSRWRCGGVPATTGAAGGVLRLGFGWSRRGKPGGAAFGAGGGADWSGGGAGYGGDAARCPQGTAATGTPARPGQRPRSPADRCLGRGGQRLPPPHRTRRRVARCPGRESPFGRAVADRGRGPARLTAPDTGPMQTHLRGGCQTCTVSVLDRWTLAPGNGE